MEYPPQYTKNIPDEIILQICTSLPAKSIGRFRCVSKLWKFLLSQPQFIKTHLNRIKNFPNEEHQSLIIVSEDYTSLFLTHFRNAHQVFAEITTTAFATKLTFDDHPSDIGRLIICMASCDGLILVQDWDDKLFVMNPTIKQIQELPDFLYAFDREDSHMCGLGFDYVNDDYKVVTLSYGMFDIYVCVYSLKNGTWKRAENPPYNHCGACAASGVLVDGYIHWLALRTSDRSSVILAFDIGEEKFREVPPPSSVEDEEFVSYSLVALGGCLCMYHNSGTEIDVWVMKRYSVKASWTKYTIIIDTSRPVLKLLLSLGKELVLLVEEKGDEKLVSYNWDDARFKDIVFEGTLKRFLVEENYLETLVSPHYTN